MVDLFATKLNHKLPMYVSPVPDSQAKWKTLNISWEGLDGYVFCPVALILQVIQKMTTYRCKTIMIAPGWLGMSWFWDLVDLSTKLPLPLWVNLLTQPFSNRLHNNLAYLNLHVWHPESVMNILGDSQRKWRSELRSLRGTSQGESMISRWSIFGKWCEERQVDISDPTIPDIANFLNCLFKEKNLKPLTIAGYRTAIADGLGLKGEEVTKSLELNRLLASFYRDKPVANRSIPHSDLALVLYTLTKQPFEPLGKASLKLLTFSTLFLLTLASSKRRSEIHAWKYSSHSHKKNMSQVTLAPSSAFLAKNQLASDRPTAIKPVVIPALKPHLDSSLTQERSFCPVRALKYYLDRTKELRKN